MAERVPPGHDSASAGDHAFYWRLSVRRRRSTVHDGVGLSDNFHHRHTAFSVLVRTSISSRLLYCGQFASHTNEDITSDICSISFRFCASFPSVLSAVFRAVPSPPLCYQSHRTFATINPAAVAHVLTNFQKMNSSRSRNPAIPTMVDMGRGGYDTTGTPKPPRNNHPR